MPERRVPPPIPGKVLTVLGKAIDKMERRQERLAKQDFKISELLTLFVDPEHHSVCTEAYTLCEPTPRQQELFVKWEAAPEQGSGVHFVRFYWDYSNVPHGFYVPRRCGAHRDFPAPIRPEAPPELVARFKEVADDLVTIHAGFANVRWVLQQLVKPSVCRSLDQIRYHWPCIVPILREAKQNALADQVQDVNPRAHYANLAPDLRRLLAPSNATIARHQLIADLPLPDGEPPVPYDVFA